MPVMFESVCCWVAGVTPKLLVLFKYRMLLEDGLRQTETCWSLQCIYMIFNFLIILTVQHYYFNI
jgi:hypothetical protein